MHGNSSKLTVVYVFSSRMKFITHVAVKNGEKIQIEGSIADNYKIRVTGSKVNERWNAFSIQNATDLAAGNAEKVDKAITKFIETNPDDVVSTLLLTCDFSDFNTPEAKRLLDAISDEAKPQQLLELYGSELKLSTEKAKKIVPLSLRDERDSMVVFDAKRQPANLLYFWYDNNDKRKEIIKELKSLSKKNSKLSVADIYMNSDTASWRSTVDRDSVKWKHYKAFGGPADRTISDLNVRGVNFIIVADSAGTQVYRGSSAKEASLAVEKLMK